MAQAIPQTDVQGTSNQRNSIKMKSRPSILSETTAATTDTQEKGNTAEEEKYPLFTFAQLKENDGVKNPQRYLSILGKIYDVTDGKNASMYEKPKPYSCFVGRDATVCFISGDFQGKKMPLNKAWDYSTLTAREMAEAVGWSKFYDGHDSYKRIGTLIYPDGADPKKNAVDPYDPLVEQCQKVIKYMMHWVATTPHEWVPKGKLHINYRNEHGGLMPISHGNRILEEEANIPPRTCWASEAPKEKTHALYALWCVPNKPVDHQATDRVQRLPTDAITVPKHFIFYCIRSETKYFVGQQVPSMAQRGTWCSASQARTRLGLSSSDPVCLTFVWIKDQVPETLPEQFTPHSKIAGIHFAFCGSDDAIQPYLSIDKDTGGGDKCIIM